MKFFSILAILIFSLAGNVSCHKDYYIYNLATDMIKETDVVYANGYRSTIPLSEIQFYDNERLEVAEIHSERPRFSWMIASDKDNTYQVDYRILVATSIEKLQEGKADMWDSKTVKKASNLAIIYGGEKLKPSTVYYWKVTITDNKKRKYDYSEPKAFMTAADLDNFTSVLPLVKTDEIPVAIQHVGDIVLADFGKDAFSQIHLRLNSFTGERDSVVISLGEQRFKDFVDSDPGYSIRYCQYGLKLKKGYKRYKLTYKPDSRNTDPNQNEMGVSPILMPAKTGEVFPFRYCELKGYKGAVLYNNITRSTVHYPFDESLAEFSSSDTTLNQIYDLCKWTMKATSFAGMFVDGDRERIPYEADALINQLSYFAVNDQYSISRNTVEHLIFNPTWPTEWILMTPIIAYIDYLYSGDNSLLVKYYPDLQKKTLSFLRDDDDLLLHTGLNITDVNHFKLLHFKGSSIRDIVDWPRGTDDDSYEFQECNAVTNAYYYMSLMSMAMIADAVDNHYDAKQYRKLALQTKKSFNSTFLNQEGLYIDGVSADSTTEHTSLHANMFPLAFGMVDDANLQTVADHIASKGMACSVYGAQFLLDAMFNAGDDFDGIRLLTDTTMRSWYNMIRTGSTLTTESWDRSQKYNMDLNHAWGAAAGNIIVRKVMGIEPTEPGFSRVRIHPQMGNLSEASVRVPTPMGIIEMSASNKVGKSFKMQVTIPPNMTADIYLPGQDTPQTFGSGEWKIK